MIKYIVYPSWVEDYLELSWSSLSARHLGYIDSTSDPISTPHKEAVVKGDQGGGILICDANNRDIESFIASFADILYPDPMLSMWNRVGRPNLPPISEIIPKSDYNLHLRCDRIIANRTRIPKVRFTAEWIESKYVYYCVSCEKYSQHFEDSHSLFTSMLSESHLNFRASYLPGISTNLDLSTIAQDLPKGLTPLVSIEGMIDIDYLCAIALYITNYLSSIPRIPKFVGHLYGSYKSKISFYPNFKSVKQLK